MIQRKFAHTMFLHLRRPAGLISVFLAAPIVAFLLRFDFDIPGPYRQHLVFAMLVWPLLQALTFWAFGTTRVSWRYISVPDLIRLVCANLAASGVLTGVTMFAGPEGFPRSIYLIDLLITLVLSSALLLLGRVVQELSPRPTSRTTGHRTLIYGAGDAGVSLLREIRQNAALPYDLIGFLDDDPMKQRTSMQGIKVLGYGRDLPIVATKHSIDIVLLAIPSATGSEMTRILQHCHKAGVAFKTIPSFGEILENGSLAGQIRDVAVEDLLGRTTVNLHHDEIRSRIEGGTVLVTGAAGSIGSELCRQIARFKPKAIVGYEISETALFHLDRELRAKYPDVTFFPELGNVQDERRLSDVFAARRPTIVYHAAAYKHVPMMELHLFQAIENNILGTWKVAQAAQRHGIANLVLISTDKAVNPVNVMGVTKRVAELIIHTMQGSGTNCVSVRFGNVLGSNGSVIPLFKEQIAAGGPVTVTHPDMERYFMTIPEAAQLVVQASVMGKGGEIFVLDMGEPVKIFDLATNLILLSGLQPEKDIRITFSGVRPGEKLFEELRTDKEDTLPTFHEKIKVFSRNGAGWLSMSEHLKILQHLCDSRDARGVLLKLKEIVPEYTPSANWEHVASSTSSQVKTFRPAPLRSKVATAEDSARS